MWPRNARRVNRDQGADSFFGVVKDTNIIAARMFPSSSRLTLIVRCHRMFFLHVGTDIETGACVRAVQPGRNGCRGSGRLYSDGNGDLGDYDYTMHIT